MRLSNCIRRECDSVGSDTIDSRPYGDCGRRRRKRCPKCGVRWTTIEQPYEETEPLAHLRRQLVVAASAIKMFLDLSEADLGDEDYSAMAGGDGGQLDQNLEEGPKPPTFDCDDPSNPPEDAA